MALSEGRDEGTGVSTGPCHGPSDGVTAFELGVEPEAF